MANKDNDAAKDVAMELAEDARQAEWEYESFTAEMFRGDFRWDLIHPFPAQAPEDKKIGDELIEKIRPVMEELDPFEVDRLGDENHPSNTEYENRDYNNPYPKEVREKLAELGLFGMKIPKEYGGLGLTVTNYARVLSFIGSYCNNTVTWLSAHQSIGVPQPLKDFGTKEQKEKYFPRFAKGEVSAFALTEPDVGSDPAKMTTIAEPTEDGKYYILNGDKLWCTNGLAASIIAVMAKTPDKVLSNGKKIPQISAFIVEMDWEGVIIERRCQFMGLRAIMNGCISFKDVKVPAENIIGKPGQGLKIALTTLNTGRLGLPAAGIGAIKKFLPECEWWCNTRVQWGRPVGQHQSISRKIAVIAADLMAMQSMVSLTCAFADNESADIRLEAAAAKYFCSETVWKRLDDYIQVRGGRGYETAKSLYDRGDRPSGGEMTLRDMRIGRIFEGSSEVMHLIMAREAMDTHFKLIMPIIMPKPGQKEGKVALLMKALKFYMAWYPKVWMPASTDFNVTALNAANRDHLAWAARTCKKLARSLFHTMGKWQAKLEYEQIILGNFVDIGTDLFVMATTLSYAEHLLKENKEDQTPQDLADLFCKEARKRIAANFKAVKDNHNKMYKKVATELMDGKLEWLSKDAYTDIPPMYRDYEQNDYDHPADAILKQKAEAEEKKEAS
jgi:alkylation response protein AidB-like acyl-CoA dehydrogenase